MEDDFIIEGFDTPDIGESDPLPPIKIFVDIVYCLDLTESMEPVIRKFKDIARDLHLNIIKAKKKSYMGIEKLRVRVIGFRDFYCDGPYALEESRFFELPEEMDAFEDFVDRLEAKGGGDIPENALEAMALAMKSDWYQPPEKSVKKRQIIVLITDAPAHPLEKAASHAGDNYPADMPESYAELVMWWLGRGQLRDGSPVEVDQIGKRLVLLAPEECEPWESVEDDFDNSLYQNIESGSGGRDISMDDLLNLIGDTIMPF